MDGETNSFTREDSTTLDDPGTPAQEESTKEVSDNNGAESEKSLEESPSDDSGRSSRESNQDKTDDEGTPSEDNNASSNNKAIVLSFVKKFCKKGIDDATISQKLDDIGVETISDISVVVPKLDIYFGDIMKPVQQDKLKLEFDRISNINSEKTSGPSLLDYNQVFSPAQLKLLNGKKRLLKSDYHNITKALGDELYATYKSVSLRVCKKVSEDLQAKFKHALTINSLKGPNLLCNVIHRRIKYRQRLDRKAKKNTVQFRKFSKRQDYAIPSNRDLPAAFPGEETKETQESKRLEMVEAENSGEIDWKKVRKQMKETYVAQRLTIHSKSNAGEILKDWPFIGKFMILKDHFYTLMNLPPDNLEKRLGTFVSDFLKYLEVDVLKPRREGHAKEVAAKMKKYIAQFKKGALTGDTEFSTLILCVALKLDQDLKHLFIYFCETTSYDEVQASNKLPKDGRPIIAVLGDDLLDTPKCFVLVDNCIISTYSVNPLKAILSVFMCYFVFKITYPKKLSILLEFIQRAIFEIQGDPNCSRIERRKNAQGHWEANPKGISQKYEGLMRDFDDYMNTWNE